MHFVNNLQIGQRVILEKFPEFRGCNLVGDNSGWDNFAIKVDNKYLFRFPKHPDAYNQIQREVEVLGSLKPCLPSTIKVPNYLAANLDTDYPFVYYEMIPGQPLTLELYHNFTGTQKESLAQNIATFLNTLHSISPKSCPHLEKVNPLKNYREFYQQVQTICFKYLTPAQQAKTDQLFNRYFDNPSFQNFTPAIIHGDLSENHILITDDGIGIIDFGDVSVFDPAIDLSWFHLFDKNLFHGVLSKYSTLKDPGFEHRICEFYIPIIPHYGIIYGEETHNPEMIRSELADLTTNLC